MTTDKAMHVCAATFFVVAMLATPAKALIDKAEREKKHSYQSGEWKRHIAECLEEAGPNRIFQGAEQYECLRKRDQGAATGMLA